MREICGDTIVHLERKLFFFTCRPFSCVCVYHILYICESVVLEICGDTMVHLESTLLNNMVCTSCPEGRA